MEVSSELAFCPWLVEGRDFSVSKEKGNIEIGVQVQASNLLTEVCQEIFHLDTKAEGTERNRRMHFLETFFLSKYFSGLNGDSSLK